MNIFLCLLGPSLFSIRIFYHLNKDQMSDRNILFYYAIFVFINNFISLIISVLLFGARDSIDLSLINYPIFTIKYLVLAIILAVVVPFVVKIINENVDYDIEVVKNEKRNNKKKN